jgi:hypothetical protein
MRRSPWPTPRVTDRDILLDAIVQRLKARKPTPELGERIEKEWWRSSAPRSGS